MNVKEKIKFISNWIGEYVKNMPVSAKSLVIGVSGGIMDQMVSSIGIHGKAFFMNCKNLEYELINFPENWKFCLIDSEVQRNLRDSSYNERFSELQDAEKNLCVEYLGEVKKEKFQTNKFVNIASNCYRYICIILF